jgi:hypothetical protein
MVVSENLTELNGTEHFTMNSKRLTKTAFYLKSIIFWNMTPCSPLSFNRRFGGTACHRLARWFAEPISSTLKMEAMFLRNVG